MLINLRNALMAGKRLPYDAEVEFLESSGTQYIDTPVVWNPFTTKVTATFSTTVTGTQYIFGSYGSAHNFIGTRNVSGSMQILPAAGLSSTFGDIHTVTAYNVSLTYYEIIDGTGATISNANSNTTNTLSIFCINGFTTNIFKGRIYRLYLTDIATGQITADFIPVRKGTVGYLYDRVSGKLFGNAGTGDFVLGQDVVPVEYIESHGTEYINSGFDITNAQSFAYDVKFSIAQSVSNAQPRLLSNEGAGAGNYYDIYFTNNVLRARQANVAVNNAQRDTPIVAKMTEQGRYYGYYESTPDALLWDATRTFTSPTVKMDYRIFGRGNDAQTQYRWQGKAWYMRFWKDGVPLRFFRPVRVGTDATSWEGAMMDVLTRRIYRNAGTGAFSYGNDLKYPIPA